MVCKKAATAILLVFYSFQLHAKSLNYERTQKVSIVVKFDDGIPLAEEAQIAQILLHLKNQIKNKLITRSIFKDVLDHVNKVLQTQAMETAPEAQRLLRRLRHYFIINLKEKPGTAIEAQKILNIYRKMPGVELAYFEPILSDAVNDQSNQSSPDNNPPPRAIPVVTPDSTIPDYTDKQYYLQPAPKGVDAEYAWKFAGGKGTGIKVVDFETNWDKNHVEFNDPWWSDADNTTGDHGTAVWGIVAARDDGQGVTGIANEASFGTGSVAWTGDWNSYVQSLSERLAVALAQLHAGDVLIIEQQARGVDDDYDYRPIEFYPAVYDALRLATQSGIHCVAAAGNGSENLDDPKWNHAFDLTQKDSGCILVGAIGSPLGANFLQPMSFSNYGSRIDAAGFGEFVASTGYGDLLSTTVNGRSATYTTQFSGTSSATPIVGGALISLLGRAKAKGLKMTPALARDAFRNPALATQQAIVSPAKNVGNLPNLQKLYQHFGLDTPD